MLKRSRIGVSFISALVLVMLFVVSAMAEPVTIQFRYRTGGDREKVVRQWIKEFEQENPDIKVDWVVPTGGWDQVIVSMAAGMAPDVMEFWGRPAQELARNGWLLDLRPYVARDFTADDIADFYPPAWEGMFIQHGPHKGEQYALPRYINTMVTYYNETLLAQVGLGSPQQMDRQGEWTWDALEEMSRKMTRRHEGESIRWGFMTMTRNWERIAQWLWEAGTDWFDPDDLMQFAGDSPEAIDVMSWIYDGIWQDGIFNNDLHWDTFWDGRVGMMDDGLSAAFTNHIPSIGDRFAWDIVPRPAGPAGRKPWVTDDGLGIWVDSPHPEEAWRFINFITSPRGQQIMVEIEGLAPIRRSVTPTYLALTDQINLMAYPESMATASTGSAGRVPGNIEAIGSELGKVLHASLVRGEKPYAMAVREVSDAIEAIVRETAD